MSNESSEKSREQTGQIVLQTTAPLLPITLMQEDVYSIPEGRIVVQWPVSLSPESVEDIKAYLKLLEGKIKRSVKKEQPE